MRSLSRLAPIPLFVPVAVRLLNEIRAAGIVADISYGSRKFPQQIKQADALGARYAVILGEDELTNGAAKLRDQATKAQRDIPLNELIAELQKIEAAVGESGE